MSENFENYFYHKPTKQHGESIAATTSLRSISVRGENGRETFRAPSNEFIKMTPQEADRLSWAGSNAPEPFLDDADEIARLIEYLRPMVEREGIGYLDSYRNYRSSACGCLGIRDEDKLPLCPCGISASIRTRLVPIMAAFDPKMSEKLRASRIAEASQF